MKTKVYKLFLPLLGFGALIWFLVRVIPKPSRAAYPCQQATFPIASAFVIYIVSLVTSSYAYLKFKEHSKAGNNWIASIFLFIVILSSFSLLQSDKPYSYANYNSIVEDPNQPMGVGKGIFPGRVVWVRDSSAVDQQCTNSSGDFWWMDANTDQVKVNEMLSKALKALTGKSSLAEAWDEIFRYYNQTHGRGDAGYTSGEKIVIKLNLNTGCEGSDNTRNNNSLLDTSPQIVYAVLDQLINTAWIAQEDIGFGDPGRNVDNIFWNKFHSVFPNVKYWGEGTGRTPIEPSNSKEFFSSDGNLQHYLPKCYVEAAYMINIPVFKQHHRAGISLACKNHIGTFVPFTPDWNVRDSLHHSFPSSQGNGVVDNGDYNLYRLFVDFMGHKDLGDKTILYLVDGLWSSTNYGDPPWKWRTAPFNNSYPASIFVSQDPVAIESVGFDFLFNEFYVGNPSGNAFPCYEGVDDFLHQAADSINWPVDILYDPESDGSYLPRSMGVHEHWNNPTDKKYSKNLGTGDGIELVTETFTSVKGYRSNNGPAEFYLENNYPNPFNPSTTFRYYITEAVNLDLSIFNNQGECIKTLFHGFQNAGSYEVVWDGRINRSVAASGVYYAKFQVEGSYTQVRKIVLIK